MAEQTFSIWAEGYAVTGQSAGAIKMGEARGVDFKAACIAHFAPGDRDFDPERLTYWGCRLFDNEADARERFG